MRILKENYCECYCRELVRIDKLEHDFFSWRNRSQIGLI
jgi:hypothetical protein